MQYKYVVIANGNILSKANIKQQWMQFGDTFLRLIRD